jgi:histidine ammonia-lyase
MLLSHARGVGDPPDEAAVPALMLIQRMPFLEQNAIMYPYIEAMRELITNGELVQAVDGAIGVELRGT